MVRTSPKRKKLRKGLKKKHPLNKSKPIPKSNEHIINNKKKVLVDILKKYVRGYLRKGYHLDKLKKAISEKYGNDVTKLVFTEFEHPKEKRKKKEIGEIKPKLTKRKVKEIGEKQELEEKIDKTDEKVNVVEFPKGEYTTALDNLLFFVDKNKSVSLKDIANKFNITEEKAEEWVRILQENNLVEVHYPLFGGPRVMKFGFKEPIKKQKKILEHTKSREQELGIFSKIGKTLTHPVELFQLTQPENIIQTLKYQLVVLLIPLAVGYILLFLFFQGASFIIASSGLLPKASSSIMSLSVVLLLLFFAIFTLVIIPLVNFLGAAVLHLFIKLYGGIGSYKETYKAIIYSSTPSILFGFIPIFKVIPAIWSFVLSIIGVSINHRISKLRSFLAIITPTIIVVGILFLLLYQLGSIPLTGSKTDELSFMIYKDLTKCSNGRISVYARNIGQKNIKKEDWKIHKIDGKTIELWPNASLKSISDNINWGLIMRPEYNFSPGEHIIELGTSPNNIKTYNVTC